MACAIVFDLGGTNLRCGFVDDGFIVHNVETTRILNHLQCGSAAEIWQRIKEHIVAYIERLKAERGTAIVFSFPGPVAGHRTILAAPTLFGRETNLAHLTEDLERTTGRHVWMVNDVSAAAWYFSTRTTARRFFVVTVSSGIGSKLFDRDHPLGVIDDPPYAGEIGHIVVNSGPEAQLCDCGGFGHLGAIASGRAIEKTARRLSPTICTGLTNEEHLIPAARAGDPWTIALIRENSAPLAQTLSVIATGAGLEKIFLIGGFAQSLGTVYLDIMADLMNEYCKGVAFAEDMKDMIVVPPTSEEICLAGAAVFAQLPKTHDHRPLHSHLFERTVRSVTT